MFPTLSWLVAPEAVIMTSPSVTREEKAAITTDPDSTMFSCGVVLIDFTHIRQDYFIGPRTQLPHRQSTHWSQVTHICISKETIIGSDNDLSPGRAKPLSEPMLEYCYLDPWEQTSVKSQSKFIYFHSRKCIWKCHQEICGHFVSASTC